VTCLSQPSELVELSECSRELAAKTGTSLISESGGHKTSQSSIKEFGECSKEFHEKRKQFYKNEKRKPGVAINDE
jgi:hypothetical protein